MSHNKWEARLWALAEEEAAKGNGAVANALRRWANGQEWKKVDNEDSFVAALVSIGFATRDATAKIRAVYEGGARPEFFMVYREGGRSPTFKHPDMVSASKEAQRICKESGKTTHVLGVVETYRAHGRPTIEEIIEHGRQYPYGDNSVGWGLWRVVRSNEVPHIVAVRSNSGATPYIAYDSDWRPGCHVEDIPDDYRWFRLDATGKTPLSRRPTCLNSFCSHCSSRQARTPSISGMAGSRRRVG